MHSEYEGLARSMRDLLAALDELLDDVEPAFVTPAEVAALRRLRENVRAALAEWQSS